MLKTYHIFVPQDFFLRSKVSVRNQHNQKFFEIGGQHGQAGRLVDPVALWLVKQTD